MVACGLKGHRLLDQHLQIRLALLAAGHGGRDQAETGLLQDVQDQLMHGQARGKLAEGFEAAKEGGEFFVFLRMRHGCVVERQIPMRRAKDRQFLIAKARDRRV